ncbi:MAG: DUF4912 domain-containing protein [Spirochaetales bacterium]|nr:MAG: DUF4912 domain-containing protein [Spirochaetales bacterium]
MKVERLNVLSIEALYALAEKMGLDLPPSLERVFVVEAIIEAYEEDNEDRKSSDVAAIHVEEKKYSGSELDEIDASLDAAPCIARRYNETVIHCIPRDPEWAFAFWDVREDEFDALCSSDGFGGFFIRVIQNSGYDGKGSASYDIPIGENDDHWYLHMPQQDTAYRLDLCVRHGSRFKAIAHSNSVRTPRALLANSLDDLEPDAAALAALSALDHLQIRNAPQRHPSRILSDFED